MTLSNFTAQIFFFIYGYLPWPCTVVNFFSMIDFFRPFAPISTFPLFTKRKLTFFFSLSDKENFDAPRNPWCSWNFHHKIILLSRDRKFLWKKLHLSTDVIFLILFCVRKPQQMLTTFYFIFLSSFFLRLDSFAST